MGNMRNSLLTIALLASDSALLGAQVCNQAPVAVDDQAGHLGAPLTIDVLANDREPDGEPLSLEIVSVSTPCLADSVVVDRGHIRLSPNPPGTPKSCIVTYRIRDERGSSATAVLTLNAEGILFWDGFESGTAAAWSVEQ